MGALRLTASSRTGGRIPGTPATGLARAGRAETTTGAAHPRSMAPVSGAVRPRGRGLGRIAGAVRRVRRTTHHPHVWPRQPTGGPGTARHQVAVPGWPGEATPGGAGRRGWRRECGSRATTPTGLRGWGASAAHARPPPRCAPAHVPRWCCDAAPRWSRAVVTPRWSRDATPRSCCEAIPRWSRDATPTWCSDAIARGPGRGAAMRPPRVALRRGGRARSAPGLRACSTTFMRLLQTCRARSRLGRFASLSPTRT